jgi:hypothetical protein
MFKPPAQAATLQRDRREVQSCIPGILSREHDPVAMFGEEYHHYQSVSIMPRRRAT